FLVRSLRRQEPLCFFFSFVSFLLCFSGFSFVFFVFFFPGGLLFFFGGLRLFLTRIRSLIDRTENPIYMPKNRPNITAAVKRKICITGSSKKSLLLNPSQSVQNRRSESVHILQKDHPLLLLPLHQKQRPCLFPDFPYLYLIPGQPLLSQAQHQARYD